MKVSEVMNVDFKKFSMDKDRLVIDAINLMDKYKTSIVLCIDKKKELRGIITERDLLDRLGSKKFGNLKTSSIRISSVMLSNPIVISPENTVYEAAQLMHDKGYTGLPVVNKELVGCVTQNEMLTVCEKVTSIPINGLIDTNPIILSENDRIIHARRIFFEKNIRYLLTGSPDNITGIITEGILARAFANFRESAPASHLEERLKHLILDDYKKSPVFVSKDITIGESAIKMLKEGVRLLVVLDDSDYLVGVISKDILIKFIKNKLTIKS